LRADVAAGVTGTDGAAVITPWLVRETASIVSPVKVVLHLAMRASQVVAVCDCSFCRLAGGRQPAEPLRHRLRAADDGAYVAGGLGRAPQH
jgi:hypothetical protein